MGCAPFDYVTVDSFEHAAQLLRTYGEDAKLLAGGQSLIPMLNLRLLRPSVLIDLNSVPAHAPIITDGELRLSALTRHRSLLEDRLIEAHAPLLPMVAKHIGNVRVRNRGTIGGSLAHGDPSAELCVAALAVDARVDVLGSSGGRTLNASDLFVGYLTTSLEPDEMITAVRIPLPAPRTGWAFEEVVRRGSDFAVVAVAARVRLSDVDGTISDVALALGGVGDRAMTVDAPLLTSAVGTDGSDESLDEIAAMIAAHVEPFSDVRASAAYRRHLVAVLTRRALAGAIARARGGASHL